MQKLYDKLTDIIDFELDKDEEIREEERCNQENLILNALFSINIIFTGFAMFCLSEKNIWGVLPFVISLVTSVIIIKHCKKRNFERINILINVECNFNKVLTVFLVRSRYKAYATDINHILLSDISNTLFYLGKFEEAKRTIDLIEKYCDTPMGNALRVFFYAMLARFNMDKEAVESCIKELDIIMSQINKPYITKSYAIALNYPLMIEVEERGDYAKALELLQEDENTSELERLSINYRLYKIAKVAGMEEEAAKHRAFVLEKGGDTFYKRELESVS